MSRTRTMQTYIDISEIPGFDADTMDGEPTVTVEYRHTPGEKMTHDYPGSADEIEVLSITDAAGHVYDFDDLPRKQRERLEEACGLDADEQAGADQERWWEHLDEMRKDGVLR